MYNNKENQYYSLRDHTCMTSSLLVGWLEFTILSYVMTPPLLDESERWLTIIIIKNLSYFGFPLPLIL
jgi:hypothetical protein